MKFKLNVAIYKPISISISIKRVTFASSYSGVYRNQIIQILNNNVHTIFLELQIFIDPIRIRRGLPYKTNNIKCKSTL